MLLAVLEKRAGFMLGAKTFSEHYWWNKTDDPALDLAVIAAVLSSNEDLAISGEILFCTGRNRFEWRN